MSNDVRYLFMDRDVWYEINHKSRSGGASMNERRERYFIALGMGTKGRAVAAESLARKRLKELRHVSPQEGQ